MRLPFWRSIPLALVSVRFQKRVSECSGATQDTHNLYLEVATNIGVQGLCAFLVFVGLLLRVLWSVVRHSEHAIKDLREFGHGESNLAQKAMLRDYLWVRAASLAVIGYLFMRLVVGLFGMDLYEIYWWLSTGFAIVLWRMTFRLECARERLTPRADGERAARASAVAR